MKEKIKDFIARNRLYILLIWLLACAAIAIYLAVHPVVLHLLLDGLYYGPCETGEGITAGMPCPETPRGGAK